MLYLKLKRYSFNVSMKKEWKFLAAFFKIFGILKVILMFKNLVNGTFIKSKS